MREAVARFLPKGRSREYVTGRSVFILLLLTTVCAPASGQDAGALEVTATLDNSFFYGDVSEPTTTEDDVESTEIEDAFGFGIRLGWRLSDRMAIEGGVRTFPTEIEARGGEFSVGFDTDVTMTEGSLLYYPGSRRARVRPFLAAGGGAVSYAGSFDTEWDAMWGVGGGVRLDMGDLVDLRFELRDYMSSFDAVPQDEDPHFQNHVVLSTGLVLSPF